MLYSSYRQKLEKRMQTFERLWKMRALIIAGALFVLAAVAALMGVKGIVFGEVYPESAEYGVPIRASASAVMGEARFEYRVEGGEWTFETPRLAGSYECRPVAYTVVGTRREGEIKKFEITPAECEITLAESTLVYGEQPRFTAQTKYGDELIVNAYSAEREGDKIKVRLDPQTEGAVTILTEDGKDATSSYKLTAVGGELSEISRKVTLKMADAEFVYDGKPHSENSYTLDGSSKFGLAEGDRLEVTAPVFTDVKDSGYNYAAAYTVYNSQNEDVTSRYSLSFLSGRVTVKSRALTVTTPSDEFTYDGRYHSYSDGLSAAEDTPLAEGHVFKIKNYARYISAGDGENLNWIEYDIVDGTGASVIQNYSVTNNFGTVKINKRQVKLSSPEKSFVYDGTLHTLASSDYFSSVVEGNENSGFAAGDNLRLLSLVYAVDAGEYKNDPDYIIVNAAGNDVTQNYEIEEEFADLIITPRDIAFTFAAEEFTYDGRRHAPQTCVVAEGYSLVSGDAPSAVFEGATEAGDYVQTPQNINIYQGLLDVTKNYNITGGSSAAFKINPLKIFAATGDGNWVYDGKPHSEERVNFSNLAAGHTASSVAKGAPIITNCASNVSNEFEFSWEIYDGAGVRRTENYVLSKESITWGSLNITPRPLFLSTKSLTADYDGKPHSAGDPAGSNLADGEDITFANTSPAPARTEAGSTKNEFGFTYKITAADGRETTSNYLTSGSVTYGEITIIPRYVAIRTGSNEFTYDGDPHSETSFEIVRGSFAEGQNIIFTYPSFIEAGYSYNEPVSYEIKDTAGNVVDPLNYNLAVAGGSVTINRRPLVYNTASESCTYDGLVHSAKSFVEDKSSMGLVKGHVFTPEYGEWTDAGEHKNALTYTITDPDSFGKDVSANYKVTINEGVVSIAKREVTLITHSGSWVYDAQPHSAAGYDVRDGEFVFDHSVKYAVYPSGTIPEKYKNQPSGNLGVFTPDDAEVTNNYKITWEYGELEITKRPITVETLDKEWTYDATCHLGEPDTISVTYYKNDTLGHSVKPVYEKMYTDAGEYDNRCTVRIEDGDGADVTKYYNVVLIYGESKIIINKREVTFTTYGATSGFTSSDGENGEWVYDGKEHAYTTHSYGNLPSKANHGFYWSDTTKAKDITDTDTEIGYIDNVFFNLCIREGDKNGTDRTSNYIIKTTWGKLRVKSPICVYVLTAAKEYDGKPLALTDSDWFITQKPPDVKESEVTVKLAGSITVPGEVTLKTVYANSSYRVTAAGKNRIDFTGNSVSLRITKREIRITTATIAGVNDGSPLLGTNAENAWWLSYGSLVAGHRFENFEVTGVLQPEETESFNTLSDFRVVDGAGNDVTEYYSIIRNLGILSWKGEEESGGKTPETGGDSGGDPSPETGGDNGQNGGGSGDNGGNGGNNSGGTPPEISVDNAGATI